LKTVLRDSGRRDWSTLDDDSVVRQSQDTKEEVINNIET